MDERTWKPEQGWDPFTGFHYGCPGTDVNRCIHANFDLNFVYGCMQERKARRAEKLEGDKVVSWTDTELTCSWLQCSTKTLASWRTHGLPCRRSADGAWWYAWPHAFYWYTAKAIREAQGIRLGYLPHRLAKATVDLSEAEDEARHDVMEGKWVPPEHREPRGRAGRFSYRTREARRELTNG